MSLFEPLLTPTEKTVLREEIVNISKHQSMIDDALAWLDDKEKEWGVKLNREEFVRDLLSRIAK